MQYLVDINSAAVEILGPERRRQLREAALTQAPGRREKRKQELRTRIESAAYTLFKQQGIEDTSIEQICIAADVARRTFYGHFANKGALLQAMSQTRVWGTADEMMHKIMDKHDTTCARLNAMIDYMEDNVRNYDAVDRALILVLPTSLSEDNHLREVSDSIRDYLNRMFSQGQAAGDTQTQFSAELLAVVVSGTLNSLLANWAIDTAYPIHRKLEETRQLLEYLVCKT